MTKASEKRNPRLPQMLAEDAVLGGLMDGILSLRRTAKKVWQETSEADQQDEINRAENIGKTFIADMLLIFAGRGFDVAAVKVGKFAGEGQALEAKITLTASDENLLNIRNGGEAMMTFADRGMFNARGDFVEAMKDAPGLFDMGETPEQKAHREDIEREAAEHEASVARARQFKPLDNTTTAGPAAAEVLGDLLKPEVKAAADRGVAHRQTGGTRSIPKDLALGSAEANAWLRAYDAADAAAQGHQVDGATGKVVREPAKPPRGHRGRRSSTEERTARRLAEAGA